MRYVRGIVDAAVLGGKSRKDVLALAPGISFEMLDATRSRVSLKHFSRLYGGVVQYLDDESAGLSAYAIPRGAVETMIRCGMTATSLTEAVEALASAINAIVHEIRVTSVVDHKEIRLSISKGPPAKVDRHGTYELILLTTYAVMAWLFGKRPPLLSADFPNSAPRHLFELRTLFAGTLRFNQAHGGLRFSAEHASLPVIRSPGEIAQFLRRSPYALIEALLMKGQLTAMVRTAILDGLPKLLSLKDVAGKLALSPRSLHRKLELEGESFQKIKDALRRDLAIHALTRTDTALKQIAIDVGFADQPSFQRAFVEWTGRPPGAWRRIAQAALAR
jgi:AraC-like DNA-binding protein